MEKETTYIVVMAAGKGTRMKSDLPKVLVPLAGTPMVQRLLNAISDAGFVTRPVIVVGHQADLVKETLGSEYNYVLQEEQLGTAHAVMVTEDFLKDKAESVMVMNGDHPMVTAETFAKLARIHKESDGVITACTTTVPDFDGWHEAFQHWGRVIRNKEGKVTSVNEYKDATDEEREIKEVNTNYFCFDAAWLWENLKKVDNNNAAGEYYLPALIDLAVQGGHTVHTISIDPIEALGINTKEQLELVEQFISQN